jgi:hypothetical protein
MITTIKPINQSKGLFVALDFSGNSISAMGRSFMHFGYQTQAS